MSQKDNLLDNPVEFLKEVRESFDIQQDVDAMKRIRHDLDVIKVESEARISKEHSKVSESNKKLNAERINVAKLERDLEYTNEESNEFGSKDELVKLLKDLDGLERNIVSLRSELDEKMKLYLKDSEIISTPFFFASSASSPFSSKGISGIIIPSTPAFLHLAKNLS